MEPLISSKRVSEIFGDSLFKKEEPKEPRIEIQGLTSKFGFHPKRLASHKDEIIEMLSNLDSNFHQTGGGGWSFLNMCNDKNDVQWTGLHPTMEKLVVLGLGVEAIVPLMRQEMWAMLPGGMPYIQVKM